MTAYRCATAAMERQEPIFATASRVDRWLLAEHSGAWSAEAVPRFRWDGAVVAALEQLAERAGARLVLIRRPGGRPAAGRRLYFADSRPGQERLLQQSAERDDQLLSLTLPGVAPGEGWAAGPERLLLVCTHGRHDPCCAIWGRPVALALAGRYPAETWECTHIGGDRFAPNLVVLPKGYYFGRVPPAEAAGIVSSLEHGRLVTRYMRGRSSLSPVAQAAQYFARSALGNDSAADLAPLGSQRLDQRSWLVRLRLVGHGELAVSVRRVLQPEAHRLTCHADSLRESPAYELIDLSTG